MVRLKTMVTIVACALAAATSITALAGIADASETITYTYDAKGRLILITHSGTVNNNIVANYTFDQADNRKNLKVTGVP